MISNFPTVFSFEPVISPAQPVYLYLVVVDSPRAMVPVIGHTVTQSMKSAIRTSHKAKLNNPPKMPRFATRTCNYLIPGLSESIGRCSDRHNCCPVPATAAHRRCSGASLVHLRGIGDKELAMYVLVGRWRGDQGDADIQTDLTSSDAGRLSWRFGAIELRRNSASGCSMRSEAFNAARGDPADEASVKFEALPVIVQD